MNMQDKAELADGDVKDVITRCLDIGFYCGDKENIDEVRALIKELR